MLDSSRQRILDRLGPEDLVLDVGAGASPFVRADWILDLVGFEDRGLYRYDATPDQERFSADTWVRRDMCEHTPWPFSDDQFDYVVCSHTLEDVRDPVWVCSELARVAKAGYIEVPSRLEEQSWGVQGAWVGWGHHHWLIDVSQGRIEFVFKHHILHGHPDERFPEGFAQTLSPEQRVQQLWWEGGFDFGERIFWEPAELHDYLRSFVEAHGPAAPAAPGLRSRLKNALRTLRG